MKAEKTFSLVRGLVGLLDTLLLFVANFIPLRAASVTTSSTSSSSYSTYLPILLGAGVSAPLFFGLLVEVLLFAAPILLVFCRNKTARFVSYALALADFAIVFALFASASNNVAAILLLVYGVILLLMTIIDFIKEALGEKIAASFQKEDKPVQK
jgi:hypothetical protein